VLDGALQVGAMATHRAVETSPLVRDLLPLLSEVYGHIATVRIREVATVGGGLAHADPSQDSPLAFLVLDASVRLASARAERTMPVEKLFLDHYTTVVEPDEVLTEVLVPLPAPRTGTAFTKFLPHTVADYPTVSVAVRLTLDERGLCRQARIALGSVGSTPIRARAAEQMLEGNKPRAELLREAAQTVAKDVDPISDLRGSADYKRKMAVVFTRRTLELALARAESGSTGANSGKTA
jgi:carbon-monoxide dehydrogenase medium subunit